MRFYSIPFKDLRYSQVFFSLKVPKGGLAFLYVLVLLLCCGIGYAMVASIEEWARGTAILRPENEVSVVRNETPGRILSRLVSHGDAVDAGDVLWTVDVKAAEAEAGSMQAELDRLRMHHAELQAVSESLISGTDLIPDSLSYARVQLELLESQQQYLGLQAAGARRAYDRENEAPESVRRADRVEDLKRAYDMLMIEVEQFLPRELAARREELRSLESRISELESALAASDRRLSSAVVTAPISGTVEDVREFVSGEFVHTGEELVRIVPEQAQRFRLVIEIPQREAGELEADQELVLRFTGFPVAEYGSVRGRVTYVPQDAEAAAGGAAVYRLRGELEYTYVTDKDGRRFPLRPGMTAEVRVITRRTPVYRYLLRKLDFIL